MHLSLRKNTHILLRIYPQNDVFKRIITYFILSLNVRNNYAQQLTFFLKESSSRNNADLL